MVKIMSIASVRTARASTKGMAITLINEDEMYKFHKIEKLIEKEVRKLSLPSTLGEGPEWNIKSKKSIKKKYYKKRKN